MEVKAQLIGVAPPACQAAAQAGFRRRLAQAHLIVGRIAPANNASRGAGYLYPIIHIILLEDPCGTETVLGHEAHHVFDF